MRERLHKGIGEAHGEIEVGEDTLLVFGVDEGQNIRMIDAQQAHIGAAPPPAVLDHLSGLVEDLHKGDGAGGHPTGVLDCIALRAQAGEIQAYPTARLMDTGRITHGREDTVQTVFHG